MSPEMGGVIRDGVKLDTHTPTHPARTLSQIQNAPSFPATLWPYSRHLKHCLILCHFRPGIMLWISKRTVKEMKKTLVLFLYSYLQWLLIITSICLAHSSLQNIFICTVSGIKENSSNITGLLNSLNSIQIGFIFSVITTFNHVVKSPFPTLEWHLWQVPYFSGSFWV